MVDFVGAGEERAEGVEFGHDAAEGEDVDGGVVVGGPEEEFRGPIPGWGKGYHLVET